MARNALIDQTRVERRRREVPLHHLAGTRATPSNDAQASLELEEMADLLGRALAALPEVRRSVFLLRQDAGLTFREIAEALDIPLGTALSHMHHTLRSLRRVLEADDART